MRYNEGPAVEVQVRVDAPPVRVWELVCDVDLPGRFSSEFRGAELLDGATAPSLGARFRGRNHHEAFGGWETTSYVTAYEIERVFEWSVSHPEDPASSWRFELEPDGDGTILWQRARIGPGRSGTSYEIELDPDAEEQIIERRLAEHRVNMQRTVDGIKALAERP